MSSPCHSVSSGYLPVQTWFVYFSLSVQLQFRKFAGSGAKVPKYTVFKNNPKVMLVNAIVAYVNILTLHFKYNSL